MRIPKWLRPPKSLNPFWREVRAARDEALEEARALILARLEARLAALAVMGVTAARREAEAQLAALRAELVDELDRRLGLIDLPEGLSPGD